jgi:hypothetical protein
VAHISGASHAFRKAFDPNRGRKSMNKLWLTVAMAASVAAMQLPASAAPVNGIPAPHGVRGIIIHHCRWHGRYYRRCPPHGPIGIVVGRRPIGVVGQRPIGAHPIGVPPGRGPGGLVNGIPAEQHVQH